MPLDYGQSGIQRQVTFGLEFVLGPVGYVSFDFHDMSQTAGSLPKDLAIAQDFINILDNISPSSNYVCVAWQLTNKHASKAIQVSFSNTISTSPANVFWLDPGETLKSEYRSMPITQINFFNDGASTVGTAPVNQGSDHLIRCIFSIIAL